VFVGTPVCPDCSELDTARLALQFHPALPSCALSWEGTPVTRRCPGIPQQSFATGLSSNCEVIVTSLLLTHRAPLFRMSMSFFLLFFSFRYSIGYFILLDTFN